LTQPHGGADAGVEHCLLKIVLVVGPFFPAVSHLKRCAVDTECGTSRVLVWYIYRVFFLSLYVCEAMRRGLSVAKVAEVANTFLSKSPPFHNTTSTPFHHLSHRLYKMVKEYQLLCLGNPLLGAKTVSSTAN